MKLGDTDVGPGRLNRGSRGRALVRRDPRRGCGPNPVTGYRSGRRCWNTLNTGVQWRAKASPRRGLLRTVLTSRLVFMPVTRPPEVPPAGVRAGRHGSSMSFVDSLATRGGALRATVEPPVCAAVLQDRPAVPPPSGPSPLPVGSWGCSRPIASTHRPGPPAASWCGRGTRRSRPRHSRTGCDPVDPVPVLRGPQWRLCAAHPPPGAPPGTFVQSLMPRQGPPGRQIAAGLTAWQFARGAIRRLAVVGRAHPTPATR
jgi:hypothetical protein